MSEDIQRITFLMLTFVLLVVAVLPLLNTVEEGINISDSYYYEEN